MIGDLSPEQQTQVRNLLNAGMTNREISRALRVDERRVTLYIRRAELRRCLACHEPLKRGRKKTCQRCTTTPMDRHRFREYGITRAQFEELWRRQDGRCALCPEHLDETVGKAGVNVDHDHDTGRVRGLLCTWCNWTLGTVERREGWLSRAASYLKS